ncbi:MAG: hypothetical protein ABUT39_11865 [Acidobacteriota bacterium]
MTRIGRIATLALALAAFSQGARASAQRETVLGPNGELYSVRAGTFGELFPGRQDVPAANSVLALDIEKPDVDRVRLLIKGTEGPDADSSPFLLYEDVSNTLFLVWEIRLGGVFPVLMLSGYKDASWLNPFAIIDYPFALKSSPQLAVTYDSYVEDGDDDGDTHGTGLTTQQRTILHLFWNQQDEGESTETFYSPIFLENGRFLGRSPAYRLNDLIDPQADVLAGAGTLPPQLIQVQRGHDQRTLVVAFGSAGRLNTLEIGALPAQWGRIADGARSHIIDFGARLYPNHLATLASEVKEEIIKRGSASFDPEILRSLAEQVASYIANVAPKTPLKVIADGARSHIIDFGARLSGRGMRNSQAASSSLVEVDPSELEMADGDTAVPSQILQMSRIGSWPAPEIGSNAQVFISEGGERALLCWAEKNQVVYREGTAAGWTAPLEIRLSDSVDLQRAYEILEQRVRNR